MHVGRLGAPPDGAFHRFNSAERFGGRLLLRRTIVFAVPNEPCPDAEECPGDGSHPNLGVGATAMTTRGVILLRRARRYERWR
jgi:hypothetical protein